MSSIYRPFKRRKVVSPPPESDYKARLAKLNALSTAEFQKTFLAKDDLLSFKPNSKTPEQEVGIELKFSNVQDLPRSDFDRCFALLRATSRDHYANSERGWDEEWKTDEMSEEDMKFVLVERKRPQSGQIRIEDQASLGSLHKASVNHPSLRDFGFLSFKFDDDDTANPHIRVPVVYVYEIHLGSNLRSLGLGKHLMKIAEHIARQAEMDKVILSVFTVNEAAEQFYRKLGYVTDETSPQPKRTRKRVIPPQWLYLSLSTKSGQKE